MYCTCYITDLTNNMSFFDDIKFKDFKDIDNFIGLMEENGFQVDRIVDQNNTIYYDILEP